MASFTDSSISFNPYVQQAPIDAYVSVGMQKQNQYNQGLQRIQSQIDTVAGLEIYRDVDKQYLQSKLNELGGDLKKVAAGDFSQYQLVNSVGGMINKIGRDNKVVEAARATQLVKKGNMDMEAARKAGKSSPENEAWWEDQVNAWFQDPNVGSSFSGKFIEYHDVDSKLRGIAEKIHEIDNSIDIPYRRDSAGNILVDKQGKPVVDDAMLRIKTKGKSAERILSNFYTSLDEKDKQQLMITANYHYRGADRDTIKNELLSISNQEKNLLSKTLIDLNIELKSNPKLSTSERAAKEAQINEISNRLNSGQLDQELEARIEEASSQPDLRSIKYQLYTQKYLTNLAQDLSYQSYQQEIMNNPYSQMGMERARLQFQYDNANRQQANFEREFSWKQAEFFAKQNKATGASKPASPGRLPTDIDTPTLKGLEQEITSLIGNKKTGEVGQLDVLNGKYAPLLTDSTLKTTEQRKAYLDELASRYDKEPEALESVLRDPNVREYLEQRRSLEIQAAQKQNLYKEAVAQSKSFENELSNIYKDVEGVTDASGKELYTAKEVADLTSVMYGKYFDLSSSSMSGGASVDHKGFLDEFKGTKYEQLANIMSKKEAKAPLNASEKRIANRISEIRSVGGKGAADVIENRDKFQSEYLAKHMPERQTIQFTLDVNNSVADERVDETAVRRLMGVKLTEFGETGALDANKNIDVSELQKMFEDKATSYVIDKKFDGSATLTLINGKDMQVVPMNPSEFQSYFPEYSRRNPIDNINSAILSSPNRTTNISGKKGDPVNAYITGYQLPQLSGTGLASLVRADVEGHPDNDGSKNDRYIVRMYVNNNGIWSSDIITDKYKNSAELQAVLQGIGTKTVHDLLKKNRK